MTIREKRVLIVDDDDAIRALLFTILRRRGFPVDQARNGEEALLCLRRCAYATMLLDLMMPVRNGWDVLDARREFPAAERPVVLVLTAGGEPRNLSAELVSGSIRKPFDVEMLVEAVAACVDTASPRDQLPGCPAADSASTPQSKIN
jgi:DNA-binding response OmpR family regulator